MDHIAIAVPSVDDWFSWLVEHFDPPVLTSPMTMEQIDRRVAFVADPDGYTVELVEIL
jgi:lactoylglutathione lyase